MTLTKDINQAARELRQERRAERAFYRKVRRGIIQCNRRPALIHNGRKRGLRPASKCYGR